jgi:hypothetical protein
LELEDVKENLRQKFINNPNLFRGPGGMAFCAAETGGIYLFFFGRPRFRKAQRGRTEFLS